MLTSSISEFIERTVVFTEGNVATTEFADNQMMKCNQSKRYLVFAMLDPGEKFIQPVRGLGRSCLSLLDC